MIGSRPETVKHIPREANHSRGVLLWEAAFRVPTLVGLLATEKEPD